VKIEISAQLSKGQNHGDGMKSKQRIAIESAVLAKLLLSWHENISL